MCVFFFFVCCCFLFFVLVCQEQTTEALICPAAGRRDGQGFMPLSRTIKEFKECDFPVPESEGIDQSNGVSGLIETLMMCVGC